MPLGNSWQRHRVPRDFKVSKISVALKRFKAAIVYEMLPILQFASVVVGVVVC